MNGRHNDFQAFVRLAVKKGANALMRERGFKRPGGGWSFYRPHPGPAVRALTDELSVSASWPEGDVGELILRCSVGVTGVFDPRSFKYSLPLDVDGDAGDLSVSINHLLRTEALPWFVEPIGFEALAKDAEHRLSRFWSAAEVHRCAILWELAGRPDDARRLREHGDDLAPF